MLVQQPLFISIIAFTSTCCLANKYQSQLYHDLMWRYNREPRPVLNSTDLLTIAFAASLIRIIDIDEKNQVFTTNLWLEMHWFDAKMVWDPDLYGNIKWIHLPADQLWTPDIVLYNNAAGTPDIRIFNDAMVYHDGRVIWKPPAIYKSFCSIDVTWFPYDFQDCEMKFGLWTYTGEYVDLRLLPIESSATAVDHDEELELHDVHRHDRRQAVKFPSKRHQDWDDSLEPGMDLAYFYPSAEWDLLNLTAARHEVIYSSCCGPSKYVDVRYMFRLRRKTLFFTCNLIIPCFLISFLTTFVFYLPDKKITFAISILVSLTVFFLVLIEIVPPTSLVVPMFGKYLLTTMILLTLSIFVSVISVNFYYRTGSSHRMPKWIRIVFIHIMARILCMNPPTISVIELDEEPASNSNTNAEPRLVRRRESIEMARLHQRQPPKYDPRTKNEKETLLEPDFDFDNKTKKKTKDVKVTWKDDRNGNEMSSSDYLTTWSFGPQPTPIATASIMHQSWPSQIQQNFQPSKITAKGQNSLPLCTRHLILAQNHESADQAAYRMHRNIVNRALLNIRFIMEHYQRMESEQQDIDEWKFVATVVDRIFLIIYAFLNCATLTIILQAPSLWDTQEPMSTPAAHRPVSHGFFKV